MVQANLLLLCIFAVASGAPSIIIKRTEDGVPHFLVSDIQMFEYYTDDVDMPEEFTDYINNDIFDRSKREVYEQLASPKSLLDIMLKALEKRRILENLKQEGGAKTIDIRHVPYEEKVFTGNEDFEDDPSPIKKPLFKPPMSPNENPWEKDLVLLGLGRYF